MAPKKAQHPPKRTPSPSSSYTTSSSDDEPEDQAKPSQVQNKNSAAALKAPQPAPSARPESSEDDTDDDSSGESESTSQEETVKSPVPNKKPLQQQPPVEKKGKEPPPSSDSESESGEDDDLPISQRARHTPDPSVKPAVSKPMGEGAAGGSKKQPVDKKRKPPEPTPPSTPNDKKRKVPGAATSKEENNEASKKPFERLWTHDDEIALLEALVDFKKKHDHEPTTAAEVDTLYNTVKVSLHTGFSRTQLSAKIGNLRRKYLKQLSKENEKGTKKKKLDTNTLAGLDLARVLWGEGMKHDPNVNVPLENGGKSSRLVRPKAEAVDSAMITSEKSKGDGANRGPLSLNELVAFADRDNGESPIIDFVANEFNWMDRDSLKRSFAVLSSSECKTIESIWDHLKLKEMEFQIHRLEAAKEIIQIVKDKEDQQKG